MIANKRGKTDHRKRFSSLPLKLSAALFTESHRVSFIRLIAFLSSKINDARQRFFPLLARQQIQTGLQLNKKRKKNSQADYLLPSLNHCVPLFQVIVKRHSSTFFSQRRYLKQSEIVFLYQEFEAGFRFSRS